MKVSSVPRVYTAESEVRVVEGETATLECVISELQVRQESEVRSNIFLTSGIQCGMGHGRLKKDTGNKEPSHQRPEVRRLPRRGQLEIPYS